MRRALIPLLFALSPAAALACGAPADGSLAGSLQLADLSADEKRIFSERFASDFAEAERLGVAADALFRFERCELNGSEPPELVALGRSPAHCIGMAQPETPACGVWIIATTPEGWVEVLEGAGTPRLAGSTTNGWYDLVLERGRAPIALKFGGVAYQEDMGDADPLADPLDDWDADPGAGGGGVDWYAFDDPMPGPAEDAFLWFYRRQSARAGAIDVLPDAYRIGVAELDDVPPVEAVMQGVSSADCAPGGCRHWVLTGLDAPAGPTVAAEFRGFDIEVAVTGGAGGRDLVVYAGEGVEIWRNDGDGWRAAR
ncbi:MAG: hypothetical protein AAF763_07655 [Pseudomonadota bacterium]